MKSVNDSDFYKEILETSEKRLVVVKFTAEWCGPCKALAPKLEKIAEKYQLKPVSFYEIDLDENTKTGELYNIRSIPTLLFFKNRLLTDRLIGNVEATKIEEFLEKGLTNEEDEVKKTTT